MRCRLWLRQIEGCGRCSAAETCAVSCMMQGRWLLCRQRGAEICGRQSLSLQKSPHLEAALHISVTKWTDRISQAGNRSTWPSSHRSPIFLVITPHRSAGATSPTVIFRCGGGGQRNSRLPERRRGRSGQQLNTTATANQPWHDEQQVRPRTSEDGPLGWGPFGLGEVCLDTSREGVESRDRPGGKRGALAGQNSDGR